MKIYLAGPMSGYPQFNYPKFQWGAGVIRDLGHEVLNPAEMNDPETRKLALASDTGSLAEEWHGETWGDFLKRDVKIVADLVDGVALLNMWHKSRGARTEAFVALQCLKPVFRLYDNGDLVEYTPSVLMADIARNTVLREGEEHYG